MTKEYNIKWVNDLLSYVKVFNTFIFEGEIHDYHPIISEGKYCFYSLEEAIARLLSKDYCVVFFDHEKRAGKELVVDQDNPEAQKLVDNPFNSFSFFEKEVLVDGKQVKNPNITLFEEYYKHNYIEDINSKDTVKSLHDLSLDCKRIRDAMSQFDVKKKEEKFKNCKPFVFILKNVSRIMTHPGNPSEAENFVLMELFGASQLSGISSKMFILVDKMNDLPTWFEAENSNSAVKKVFLPAPDPFYREAFFYNELYEVMKCPDDQEKEEKLINKFVAFTDGFSARRLLQLKDFVSSDTRGPEDPDSYLLLKNFEKTVMFFNNGVTSNPWTKPETKSKMRNINLELNKAIKGQNDITWHVKDTLVGAVTGVTKTNKNDRRPRAVFFLAGPTGTGKTELTKTLAKELFGNEDAMIRFDMSEFREDHTDSRLFGAPPGYIGYEDGGELTKAVKNNPFSIILFDEIEKASPKIWDKFLQILGDGRLTDGKGETIYFTQTVIVFTSNLGVSTETNINVLKKHADEKPYDVVYAELAILTDKDARAEKLNELEKAFDGICRTNGISISLKKHQFFQEFYEEKGFDSPEKFFDAYVRGCTLRRIEDYFDAGISRKEVLGRIGEDNILVYHFIDEKVAVEIADNKMDSYCSFLKDDHELHFNLTISDEAKNFIYECIKSPAVLDLGGRGIVTEVENRLSKPVGAFLYDYDEPNLSGELVIENKHLVINKK